MHACICNKDLYGEVIPVVEHSTSDYRWAKYASKKHVAIYRNSYAICRNIAKISLMQMSILPLNLVADYSCCHDTKL